jgi:hypothetical protein
VLNVGLLAPFAAICQQAASAQFKTQIGGKAHSGIALPTHGRLLHDTGQ